VRDRRDRVCPRRYPRDCFNPAKPADIAEPEAPLSLGLPSGRESAGNSVPAIAGRSIADRMRPRWNKALSRTGGRKSGLMFRLERARRRDDARDKDGSADKRGNAVRLRELAD